MATTELKRLEARARRAYELGRLWRALAAATPFLALTALALVFAREPHSTLGFGLATTLLGAGFFWYGQAPARGVLPGALAGLLPLSLSLCANGLHHCDMGSCSSWCVPACMAGGLAAGFWVSTVALRRGAGAGFWWGASAITLCTGAMGCACIGATGVIGLVGGYVAACGPGLAWARLRS